MPYESTDEHDYQDGVLAAAILQIMHGLGLYTRFVHERLELSFLNFMQQFRKIYIGDSTHRASKVYKRLSEMLRMNDQNEVLDAIVKKM
jgi:exportin-7